MAVVHHHKWVGQPAATLPSLRITTASVPGATVGSAYSTSLAATGGLAPYTWSLLSVVPNTGTWLSLSSAGLLSGTPGTPETETLLAQVVDSQGTKASAFLALVVTGTPLQITTSSPLPNATAGSPYSTSLAATGGVPPYTWSLVSASPNTGAWISVSSGGTVGGTPGSAEVESIVVRVTDSLSATTTANLQLTVISTGLPLLFSDGFESGDLSHVENGISWGASTRTAVTTQNANGGTHALRFTFDANADAEQRFALGAAKNELIIQFDLYIPNGAESYGGVAYNVPNVSPNNNKVLRVWNGNQTDGNNGYSTFYLKVGASTTRSAIASLIQEYGKNAGGVGEFGSGAQADAGNSTNIITSADLGHWITLKFHLKAATAAGNNGVIEFWKNGAQLISFSGADIYPSGGAAQNGFTFGYLLGFANANPGLSGSCFMFVDNVSIWGN